MSVGTLARAASLGAAAMLIGAATSASAGSQPLAPQQPAAMVQQADLLAALNLTAGEVVTLAVDTTKGRPLQVVVPIDGFNYVLDLAPFSVRADNFVLLEDRGDGMLHEVDPGPVETLRGAILGMEGSIIAGGMLDDGLYATVIFPDGRQYWLEPIAGRVPGAVKGHYALYPNGEAGAGGFCGTDPAIDRPLDGLLEDGQPEEGVRGATMWTAEVATDADFQFFTRWGGTTQANSRISTVLNTMNLQYERDVDIRHVISSTIVRTTAAANPYSSNDSATLLGQIRSHWNANHQGVNRDTVHMFTDRNIDGSIIGRAYVGVICASVTNGSGYGFSQLEYNNNFMSATDLVAHELGHNWNACHCPCTNPALTMNPGITSINRFRTNTAPPDSECGNTSVAEIIAHRNSRNCLTTSTPGLGPPNDACASSTLIDTGTFGFNNLNSTNDGPSACATIGADVWYRYVPDCDGTLTVTTCGSTYDTILVAYTGGCASLTEIACNDDDASCAGGSPAGRQSRISFAVTRGTTYRLRVAGWNGATGHGVLNVTQAACPAPPNNNCSNSILVSNGQDVPFSTIGATTDGPLEPGPCTIGGYEQIGNDIWFRYVAPCGGPTRVSTCGSNYDTKIAVYTVCPGSNPAAIACNDDNGPGCAGTRASLDFNATSGTTYRIRVGGWSNQTGTGTLRVTSLNCPPPPNSNCTGSTVMAMPGTTGGTTVGAGPSSEASACAGVGLASPGVWHHFVSPGGTIAIDTCTGTSWDTVLRVFTGSCASLSCVASNDQSCGDQSRVQFNSTAGTTYRVYVSGFGSANGAYMLRGTVIPANNECANAIDVSAGGTFNGTLVGATNNGTATCGASATSPDVFYRFTAPASGACPGGARLVVTTCGTHDSPTMGMDTVLALLDACGGDQLDCNDDTNRCGPLDTGTLRDSRVTADLTPGQTVIIRVSVFSTLTPSPFVLRVSYEPRNNDCTDFLAVGLGTHPFCTLGATTDGPAEVGLCNQHNDVWFSFTAPCSAPMRVSTCGANYDSEIAIYEGPCSALAAPALECNDDSCGFQSNVTFAAVSGVRYLIRVGGFSSASRGSGDLVIRIGADWDGNGVVNSTDISAYITSWLASINGGTRDADFNNDNTVNSTDISSFITAWLAAINNCG